MDRDRPDRSSPDRRTGREEVREHTRRQLIAVAISAGVLLVAGAVALVLLGGDGDGDGDGSDDPAEPDAATSPADPGGDITSGHPSGLDPRHPLVGSPEIEARTVYPVVRVEWVDGEARMLTMDQVPGRVGIAVEGGVIVAAGAEGCESLPPDPASWQQQACDPSADDGATVWGRLRELGDDADLRPGEQAALVLEPGAGADRYYERMQVVPFSTRADRVDDGRPVAVDLEGGPVEESEFRAGQPVWLWITGGCEERYPVACPVDAIVVAP